MPMIKLPIPETTESVTRPVMLDVIRQLMDLTGISRKTNIAYFGDMERSKQLNSAIGGEVGEDDPNKFAHNDKLTIEVSESYYGDLAHQDAVEQPENLLIFQDAPLSIIMKPVYAQMDATISIKFRASSENMAKQWQDFVKGRISQKRALYMHNVTYSFGIPEELLYILKELHRLRENVAGFGEDFDTYFENHRTPKMTLLTNQSGSARLWAVPETQVEIQGWFDWEYPEKATKDGDMSTYTTTFNYRFRYARPTEIFMAYPLMVHNQMLAKKFRDVPIDDHNELLRTYSMTSRVFHAISGVQDTTQSREDFGFALPSYDEFWPKMTPKFTRRVLTLMFALDPENPHQFLNLGQIKGRQLHPDILTYIQAERDYVMKPGMSGMHVSLYKNEFLIDPNPVPFIIDEHYNVIGQLSTNWRVQHHLRIALYLDWQSLRGGALARMQDHGRAAIRMLEAIDPTLKVRGFLPVLIDDNYVSKTSLLIAIANLRPAQTPMVYGPTGMMYTVQHLLVETDRQ